MTKPRRSASVWITSIVSVLLLSGCAALESGGDSLPGFLRERPQFGEETRREWCRAMLENAPSAGPGDTAQTIEDVADIAEVIDVLCEDYAEGG